MVCPRCGRALASPGSQCPSCKASSDLTVAAGVLTPPPTSVTIGPLGVGGLDADATVEVGSLVDGALTMAGPAAPDDSAAPTMVQAAGVALSDGDAQTIPPPRSGAVTGVGDTEHPGGAGPAADTDTGPLAIGERFGARYRITRLLGVGGMGAVYEAWDGELGVSVALKVIRPEVAGDPGAAREMERRFKRELLLARQVTHKNVVRIHDLGEIDGIKYITMPYIEGDDLGSILKSEGRLPVPRALGILRQALSGLVAAHAAGIVHRDLKPANIMVDTEGQALLMDFGIARSIGIAPEQIHKGVSHSAPGAFGDTIVGAVVGTIHYMAPEQARAQQVDHRADIYAFGLILRDSLIGFRRQESAPTALAELQKRLDAAPEPLRTIDASIPEPLDRIVTRCLAPDPASRYQTTAELEADLNRLDNSGELIPIRRVVGIPLVAAVVSLLLSLSGGAWWYARSRIPPAPHDPVSVVIADFANGTGDPAFERTLEPMLKRALEGAGFIAAYDRSGIARTLGVRPPEKLDEAAAREIAVKQGLGVVLSGTVDRQGSGFAVSVKAAQAVTGEVITSARGRASNKDQVLEAATRLVTRVRSALGDETSESAQLFAMASVSATSLEVVRHYAAAREAAANGKLEDARRSYSEAVELDPRFGIGYQALASVSQNLGNLQDSEKYIKEALRYLDNMTERERYSTRGVFDFLTGDYQQCVKEYTDLIARYPADVAAHNNLALCLTYLRRIPEALAEMRRVVELVPNQLFFRSNLAMFANYASDFQLAEEEARKIEDPDAKSVLALAFAQVGQGRLAEAVETYRKLGRMDAQGASFETAGLADLASYEGRFSDAVRILERGAAVDLKSKDSDRAAVKFASLAYAHLWREQKGAAVAAAEKALANSKAAKIRFLAARAFVEAGDTTRARPLVTNLASELQAEAQAYARLVDGQIALAEGDPRQAIKVLTEANTLFDTWLGHFDLGRAYLEVGALPQADGEFDRCLTRRGEAISLFLDEDATYAFFPAVYYYQGRVREELKSEGFRESYRRYLDIRAKSAEDPFLAEVRRRAGSR